MTTADQLHQAADVLKRGGCPQHARLSRAFALALAGWLDDTAADKTAGRGTIHPRAIDLTNLILGDTA